MTNLKSKTRNFVVMSLGLFFIGQPSPIVSREARIELFLQQIAETEEGRGFLVDDRLAEQSCCRYVEENAPWYNKEHPRKIRLSASTLEMVRRELRKDPDFLPSPSYLMHSRLNEDGITFGIYTVGEMKAGRISVVLGSSRFLDISPDGKKTRFEVGF